MKIKYCPNCNNENEVNIITKQETFNVKGEDFSIKSSVYICKNCSEEIFDEVLDEENLELVYTQYRKKHNLLSPIQIRNIREKYNLSQRSLGKLLEWGEITINRYENGAIQDAVHNEILEFIENPEAMLEIFEKNNHLLSPYTRNALKEKLNGLIEEEVKPLFHNSLKRYLLIDKSVNEYSGYKELNIDKLTNMILYITKKTEYKTKINKLLWYMDFLFFKEYSVSISGSVYYCLPYGPILDDYDLILGTMIKEKLLNKEEVSFENDIVGERFKANVEFDESLFNETELKIMKYVLEYFKDYNCRKISEYSHKEKPYKSAPSNERISYNFASTLSINLEK